MGAGVGGGQEHREAGTWITITLEPGLVPGKKPRALPDQDKEFRVGPGKQGWGRRGWSESHAEVPMAPNQ